MPVRFLLAAVVVIGLTSSLAAQSDDKSPGSPGTSEDQASTEQWRIGMTITASGGPCTNLVGTVTVPRNWPGLQEVREVSQDLPPGAAVQYKQVEATARQMVAKIPRIAAGQEAKAIVTFEIKRTLPPAPEKTDGYTLADRKSLDRAMHVFLGPSQYIESTDPKIQALAKEIGADKQKAWDHVHAIYDWVRAKVEYKKDSPTKNCLQTLQDGFGDCKEMASLFIAICRAQGIPARIVRVPKHVYAEFYLLDDKGQGHWFPCELTGPGAFGYMPKAAPILQRGDNYHATVFDPQTRKFKTESARLLPDTLTGAPRPGGGQPQMKVVCERVTE